MVEINDQLYAKYKNKNLCVRCETYKGCILGNLAELITLKNLDCPILRNEDVKWNSQDFNQ